MKDFSSITSRLMGLPTQLTISDKLVISRFSVPETLELIKEQTGLKLELCDCFTGIKEHNGRKYFNIILRERTSESKEYDTLKRFADKYKIISVEPNGLNRVAVFQNGL